MDPSDNRSREELIRRIEELEEENRRLAAEAEKPYAKSPGGFRQRYAARILDTLPDMLSVMTYQGVMVDVVSSEQTNHVGEPAHSLLGRNISSMLSQSSFRRIKDNLDRVAASGRGSTSNHDITLNGVTRHYENRIFPLEGDYALCMCRDITDEHRVHEELEQANRRMAKAEKIADLHHWYYYEESDELEAPGIIPRLAGNSSGNARCSKSSFMTHVFAADREKLLTQFSNPVEGEDYVEFRIPLAGRTRYLHSRVIYVYHHGHHRIVEGYTQDMTYMVERFHELEAVKYALNNAVEEIYACSTDGTVDFANKRFRQHNHLYGDISRCKVYELDSLRSTPEQWQERVEKIRRNDGQQKFIVKFKDNDSKICAMELMSYLIYDPAREQERVWFFARDITMRLAHETRVKELNSVMDTILNNIPVYLFVKDPGNEFRYLYWNKAFEEYSRIPASQALGSTDFDIFPDLKDAEKFRRDDLELLRTGERVEFLEQYTAVGGETRIVTTSKALVPTENKLPLIIGISWDVTEIKRAEQDLIAARIKAEESDRLKSAFLANMSHEIRTPLNAIVGFSKLIGEAENEAQKNQFIEIIDSNSELLLQLINDILDISKIEAGTLEFVFQPMNLGDLCREQFEIHKSRVHEGVELVLDEKIRDVELICDHNRLAQLVSNLINNAIKFTDRGQIRFGFDVREGMIEFYVSDTGVGIPSDKVDAIFDRFVKLDNFAAGTGLGLAISKMIVEKMDGSISVASTEGKGTTFRFTLPYRNRNREENEARQSAANEPGAALRSDRKILVAEDIDSNYMLIKAFLGKHYIPVRARNGREAVELFRAQAPDLILMDVKMPVMDGLEATRLIRAESATVPIIALTAFAFESDRSKAFAAGCNDYLTKPVSQELLNEKLEHYLGQRP